MSKYCITEAGHTNENNHCASEFKVWEYDTTTEKWTLRGRKSIYFVSDLLADGHTVLSGKEGRETLLGGTHISEGAAIELELRIAENETNYKITEMPRF